MLRIVRRAATPSEVDEMLQTLGGFIKLAVDVRLRILAGGGILHADCEAVLLKAGSRQEDIWGADWNPLTREVTFDSLINIRPRQGNRSMTIRDSALRSEVEQIVIRLLGGTSHA
jgi:uncharacterized protein DUF5674